MQYVERDLTGGGLVTLVCKLDTHPAHSLIEYLVLRFLIEKEM